jgi:hypothetical protein
MKRWPGRNLSVSSVTGFLIQLWMPPLLALRFSLSGLMSSLRTGREIPSFFILAIKVVRFSPSRAAAPPDPPITQPASRNACKIRARVESLNAPFEGVTVSGFLSDTGRGTAQPYFAPAVGDSSHRRTPSAHLDGTGSQQHAD